MLCRHDVRIYDVMKVLLPIFILSVSYWCGVGEIVAQNKVPLPYKDYLASVYGHNLEYAAERLNSDVAVAGVQAAKVFNDPQLFVEYGNNQERKLKMGQSVALELAKTVSFGKRSAAIGLAQKEKELTDALLADYFRNLRADVTLVYLEALKAHRLYHSRESAYLHMERLAKGDSIRQLSGKVTGVDAVESRLEANIMYNGLQQARTEMLNVLSKLSLVTGSIDPDTLYVPESSWQKPVQQFDLKILIEKALANRTDLVVAQRNVEVAQKGFTVACRERNMDIDLALNVGKNTRVRNEEAPAPPFTGVTACVGIPLKFSNLNRGAVDAARIKVQQSELQYRQAELQVQSEVIEAYRNYKSLGEQVSRYENGLLQQASQVVKGKIDSYKQDETSLLDVLDAQRTCDEVNTLYIEALFSFSAALVELERSAGIWDIEL